MTRFVVDAFEQQFCSTFGVPNAIAVSNGTSALIACLWSLDLAAGDEVITTPFTFVATANAIVIAGGVPVFADVDADTLLIDPREIARQITPRTRAILPVHLFGQTCDMEAILVLAARHELTVIEDAAQAFGARTERGFAGTLADAGCFSFYQSKNLSTFEGGMIAIPEGSRLDPLVVRAVTNQGDVGGRCYERIGFNFRMPEPCALMGLHLLTRHWPGIMAELGRYSTENGYYPKVIYQQPAYVKLGLTGNCPVAEAAAARVAARQGNAS